MPNTFHDISAHTESIHYTRPLQNENVYYTSLSIWGTGESQDNSQ